MTTQAVSGERAHSKQGPRARRSILTLLAASALSTLLASCGGGDGADADAAAQSGPTRAKALGAPAGPIPADADTKGMWSAVTDWPLIPVHAVLLPDGRVMSYGTTGTGQQTGKFIYDVWDPQAGLPGSHLTIPKDTLADIFCSSQLVLPDSGAVVIAGGDNWTGTGTTNTGNNGSNVFTPGTNSLAAGSVMNRPRWYSSSTTLLNGETYIQGGSGGTDLPEVRSSAGTFRPLGGASTGGFDFMYPRNFIAPDGRVFGYDSVGQMYYVDPSGSGSVATVGQFPSAYTGSDASAAMFRPGRILQFGGNSNGAAVIDIRGGTPTFTPTQSMSSQRRLVTATVLADGKVLATGGSRTWNELDAVNNIAEIWNPDTGTWTQGSSGVPARLYHSIALLMPDATVLVGGGGAPGPQNNLNVEVYYPPYLFAPGGVLAERPVIAAAPGALEIGKTFGVQVSSGKPIARVVMVKTGSVTHSWNMEQRFVELVYVDSGNNQLSVQAPARAADAPPGFYMLFVLDAAGVPSVAKIVRVNVAAQANPAVTPSLTSPGDQSSVIDSNVTLQLSASDPNGDVLGYAANGLPPGLALDSQTGAISGQPTTLGVFNVVVAVSDGVNSATASFTWTVSGAPPLAVTIPLAPAPSLSGSTINFTASANSSSALYKWNFGDGTAETPYTSSPTAGHVYAKPGLYYVTVTVTDERGLEQRQIVLQAVYLPPTAQKPSASTNILVETRAVGGNRLWVVNQDNDSVTVFDATTRAKLAEVPVGAGPRTLALAPGGAVWVVNKFAGSLSVIDPSSLTVSRTITLPRGSQPFGIAMAPVGGFALVALEGAGQVLKLDTASYAQTGNVGVGSHPRHISISADGSTAYVSRFITPPLPGEATVAVDTSTGGGEVVVVGSAAMNVLRTIVLAHSDKPDFENQGRGVPNYLGAAVVSPDGTQAWVPSKQDNIKRGTMRDGAALNFQNTVRAISSRIDLAANAEDLAARIDHDNASVASAAAYDPNGVYLFVALETSREVAVIDAHGRRELFRVDVGRAPQGLAVAPDGKTLYVNNFMDRTVGVYDLQPMQAQGTSSAPLLATLTARSAEKLSANVFLGKQLFYDARDTRLARDRYMSCATCHNDGGHDGRTWDLSSFGEGLRNTIALRGRASAQGLLHWSANFDEVQDFEGQIRALSGGTGLMSDAQFNTGTRNQPLGDRKSGVSADLDALAAYVASLDSFAPSPFRNADGTLSSAAQAGRVVFQNKNCAQCHAGTAFTASGDASAVMDIGTLKASSGSRLYGPLTGIDIPTLRDVWSTAPYLHDGSAPTLDAAVQAHASISVTGADLTNLSAYLREIGSDESSAPVPGALTGSGLTGRYYANRTLSGDPVLTRTEAVDFDWGSGSPGTGVGADNFSVRWTGTLAAPTTGSYAFQTYSDDGIRVWVNGVQLISNWTDHSPTTNTSANITLNAGQVVNVVVEYYENGGGAVARLRWRTPGASSYVAVPKANLFADGLNPAPVPQAGGLAARYFNNTTLSGTPVLSRTEAVDYDWGSGSPGTGVNADNFSVRWSGSLQAPVSGSFRFQTVSDDGVRLWVNGVQLINRWNDHSPTTDTSGTITLTAGQKYSITMEYYEKGGGAVARLRWLVPGTSTYVAIPGSSLFQP